ncbi:MAG: hypothetical protein SGJ13_14800 [Actinomycetota bacterium]|nr:hypothetical protein [Actinomycetota bacterium]
MLERLAEDATSEMATWLLGDSSVALDLDRITRDAGGNPLFVEELVAAQDPARVPHAVRDLMLVRFDALDGDARHFVRTAALIGPRAPRAWLAAATGLDEDRVHSASRAVLDAGLLLGDDDGRGYLFRHALLRQAILDDLGPDERVRLHRAIAGALTDHPERAAGVDQAAELAYHWDAAEEPGPALRWAVAAARNAESRYAFGAAADAYERALFWWDAVVDADATANVDHAALLLAAAEAAGLAGHVEHAADLGRAALESAIAIDPSRGADAAARVFPLLWTADRTPELFEYASRTFEPSLDVVEPHARAAFLVASVVHLVEHASLSETLDVARRMMEAVEEVDDPSIAARAHAAMATCYELSGEFGRVDEEFEEAARLAESTRAYSLLAMVQYNHAAFCLSTPDLRRGMSRVDSVEELVGRFGLRLSTSRRVACAPSSYFFRAISRRRLRSLRRWRTSRPRARMRGFSSWSGASST